MQERGIWCDNVATAKFGALHENVEVDTWLQQFREMDSNCKDKANSLQGFFYSRLLESEKHIETSDFLAQRFTRWWEADVAGLLAEFALHQMRRLWGKVPPCVAYAVLNTWLNGWGTARRMQIRGVQCWLNCECSGEDAIEHYATCPVQWEVIRTKTRVSVTPTFESFLLLSDLTNDELVIMACHIYAVRNAVNKRKNALVRMSGVHSERLIWLGHKTAKSIGRGVAKIYAQQWV